MKCLVLFFLRLKTTPFLISYLLKKGQIPDMFIEYLGRMEGLDDYRLYTIKRIIGHLVSLFNEFARSRKVSIYDLIKSSFLLFNFIK